MGKDAFELALPEASKAIYDVLSSRMEGVTKALGSPTEVWMQVQ